MLFTLATKSPFSRYLIRPPEVLLIVILLYLVGHHVALADLPCVHQASLSLVSLTTLLFLTANCPSHSTTKFDATGKQITFYTRCLVLSHSVKPLLFYSDTKHMDLVTKLKAVHPLGVPFVIFSDNY